MRCAKTLGATIFVFLATLPAHSQLFTDDFNDNTKDPAKWGQDTVFGNARLQEINQRLEYSVANPHPDFDSVLRPWIGELPLDRDWQAVLTVRNGLTPLGNANGSIGLGLLRPFSTDEAVLLEFYADGGIPGNPSHGFFTSLETETEIFGELETGDLNVTSGALRLNYTAATRVVTTSYDRDGPGAAFDWQAFGHFGLGGSGGTTANRNWNLAPDQRFTLILFGFSEGAAIPAGTVWADDFSLTLVDQTPPTIVAQPQARTAALGSAALLEGSASGAAPMTYQWLKNGTAIPGATGSVLSLPRVQFADAGSYQLQARNPFGAATSQPAVITVGLAPAITSQPRGQTAVPGTTVTLAATVGGTPPLALQWLKNGTPIPGATNPQLDLGTVQPTDAGSYQLSVQNPFGSVNSAVALVTILSPPTITVQPAPQSVPAGQPARFQVTATGDAPLRFQWRRNGVNIPGATTDTLLIPNVTAIEAASFTVRIDNPVGSAESTPVILNVSGVPSAAPADQFADRVAFTEVMRGNNLDATREAGEPLHAGKPGGRSVWFRWTAPGDGIATIRTAGSTFDTLLAVYTGTSVDALSLVAEDEDSGGFLGSSVSFNTRAGVEYQVAVDGFGGATGRITVTAEFAPTPERLPRILSQPRSQSVLTGASATLEVLAETDQPLSHQWFRNDLPIPGATAATLTLANIQPTHAGVYTVRVSNPARSVLSTPALLEVGAAPAAVSQDKFLDLFAGLPPQAQPASSIRRPTSATSVASGVIGSQVLNNFGAGTEPDEPAHAGRIGGASRWFRLRADSDGILVCDTLGSEVDTLLAVYQGTRLADLTLVASDDNGAPDGVRSQVRFAAVQGRDYLVAVDGVNGAQGVIRLNWFLGQPPTISGSPRSRIIGIGGTLHLATLATGTPVLGYQWQFNGLDIVGETNATLALPGIAQAQSGHYRVVVSNPAGSTPSDPANINVVLTPTVDSLSAAWRFDGRIALTLTGTPQLGSFVIHASTNLIDWSPVATNQPPSGTFEWVDDASTQFPLRFYRATVLP